MSEDREMPKYRCHKVVRALKLAYIGPGGPGSSILRFAEPGYEPITVASSMFARYMPQPGDYYVVYEDGYASASPAKAFEAGYISESFLPPVPTNLRQAIEQEINKHSAERGSNTPDYVLAEFLTGCLNSFDHAVRARERFYGRDNEVPGRSIETKTYADGTTANGTAPLPDQSPAEQAAQV